jgi:POT family proton-dependent oligopeptide transporter
MLGLGLIALGSGGIKPCVSANVGDQFGESNKHHLSKVFGWFYFSINAGSFLSTILCPICSTPELGPALRVRLAGIAMVIATISSGPVARNSCTSRRREWDSSPDLQRRRSQRAGAARHHLPFVAVFWSLWDQSSGGAWTLQARNMDLNFLGMQLLPEQVQTANPILILLFIPIVNYLVYPFLGRFFEATPLRRIGIGLGITAVSFLVIAYISR